MPGKPCRLRRSTQHLLAVYVLDRTQPVPLMQDVFSCRMATLHRTELRKKMAMITRSMVSSLRWLAGTAEAMRIMSSSRIPQIRAQYIGGIEEFQSTKRRTLVT